MLEITKEYELIEDRIQVIKIRHALSETAEIHSHFYVLMIQNVAMLCAFYILLPMDKADVVLP